jgi:hypothetical protein
VEIEEIMMEINERCLIALMMLTYNGDLNIVIPEHQKPMDAILTSTENECLLRGKQFCIKNYSQGHQSDSTKNLPQISIIIPFYSSSFPCLSYQQ